MNVTICGPNLSDQSRGSFHVHTADCADLRHYGPGRRYGGDPIRDSDYVDADTRLEVVEIVLGDTLDGDPPEVGLIEFWFAPCVDDLPLGITPQPCAHARFMFYSQIEAAALLKG